MENQIQKRNELFFYPVQVGSNRRRTIAGIIDEKDGTLRIGISECSHKDMFEKKKGRMIAKGRALSKHAQIIELDHTKTPPIQFVELAKHL